MSNSNILSVCVEAVRTAGDFLYARHEQSGLEIEKKPDHSLVTNLDKEAERMIIDRIRQSFPGHGIIGEESGDASNDKDYIWVIDPLDGTHNFIRQNGIFGVSIGIVHRERFVAGAVYLPVYQELFTAEEGCGAYKNGQRIRVSPLKDLSECTISYDSEIRHDPELKLNVLRQIATRTFNIRMLGSSARIFTYVAEGKLDAAVEFNDKPWDFAGSVCLIREAGGTITALDGGELTYRHIGSIASNGRVHSELVKIINSLSGQALSGSTNRHPTFK